MIGRTFPGACDGRYDPRVPALIRTLFPVALLIAAILAPAAPAGAEPEPTTWLCRPGQAGPCGDRQDAPVDCFYVYPTVSLQQTTNADRSIGPEQRAVAALQAAPFAETCTVWAPVYRQSTLLSLRNAPGPERSAALDLAYEDLRAAWVDYLADHNNGRGVVLIGHSQGTAMLRTLIRQEIEDRPVQRQLVSALLLGGNVLVRKGETAGGDFATVPACERADQIGCVVAFSAYGELPPDIRYGFAPTVPNTSGTRGAFPYGPDYEVLCTDPAALVGRAGQPLRGILAGREVQGYRGRCLDGDGPHVLLLEADPGAAVPPANALPAVPDRSWGLHLLDVNVAQRDLIDLTARQVQSYLAGH